MKKLALSVVCLLVAGAGVSVSAVGCSSSSSTAGDGGGTDSSMTTDDGGSTEAATDDSSMANDSQMMGDTTMVTDSGTTETSTSCTDGGVIGVVGADGGVNQACMDNIAANCGNEQCLCTTDSNTIATDAGTYPGCALYVLCVYTELSTLLQTTDAGAAADLGQAQADCAGPADAGAFAAASVAAGDAFYGCLAGSQTTLVSCLP